MAAEEEAAPPTPWYDSGVVWYGSLRGAAVFGGAADDARITSGGSKWGIKGTSQVSEGLTAVYNFETGIDEDANQSGNVIYAGLSGGFGNLNIGKFHNASYLSGGIRDQGNAFGDSDVSTKVGNTVSYSYSSEVFTLQADAIMDNGTDTSKAVDEVQFGLSVNLGDIGKVALAYEKKEDSMTDINMGVSVHAHKDHLLSIGEAGAIANLGNVIGRYKGDVVDIKDVKLMDGYMIVKVVSEDALTGDSSTLKEEGGVYYHNVSTCIDENVVQSGCKGDEKETGYYLVKVATGNPAEAGDPTKDGVTTYTVHVGSDAAEKSMDLVGALKATGIGTAYGYKRSHISAAFGLGGVTARLGHTSTDSNSPMMTAKAKTNFLGFTGTIGDTGMNWLAYGRNKEDHAGKETSPWGIGVGKTLGGGAYTYIEHENADDGNNGSTRIGLNIDF